MLGVDGMGEGVKLETESGAAAPVQTLTFKCEFIEPGNFKRELKIKTDAQEEPVTVTLEGAAE